MAIGFAGDAVGKAGDAAGMLRRLPPGEAGNGKVKAAPEEMDRAGLAEEARPEALEDRHDPGKRVAQKFGGILAVASRTIVLGKG